MVEISLSVPKRLKDAVAGELFGCGAAGLWETGADSDASDAASNAAESVRLVAYFDESVDWGIVRQALRAVFDRAGSSMPETSVGSVEERDWTEEWKKSYGSFPIGTSFFVIPSWMNAAPPAGRHPLFIDPGQAFGAGMHETTQLVIEAMERWIEPRHAVLDLGTGAGILAIAARLLSARSVAACDTDPVAVAVARDNFGANAAADIRLFCGSVDAVGAASADIVLANLTAGVIVGLFPEIRRVLKPGGIVILSGILGEQLAETIEVLKAFDVDVLESAARGEWAALVTT